jgi:hypothetical protein
MQVSTYVASVCDLLIAFVWDYTVNIPESHDDICTASTARHCGGPYILGITESLCGQCCRNL